MFLGSSGGGLWLCFLFRHFFVISFSLLGQSSVTWLALFELGQGHVAKTRKGKIRNMRCDLRDPLRIQFQFGPDPRDHVARMRVVDHLSDDAVRREPDLVVVGRQIEHVADQFAETIVNRPHGLVDHARHCGSGLGEFVHHQPEVPSGTLGSADSQEHGVDQFAKSLLGTSRAADRLVDDSVSRRADRMPKDFGVQLQLVAEMVVHQCDVDAGARANLPYRRGLESGFGKYLPRGVQQLGACVLRQYWGALIL